MDPCPFAQIFPRLVGPFVVGPKCPKDGTHIIPDLRGLKLVVYKDDKVVNIFYSDYPTVQQVSSGFNISEHASKIENTVKIVSQVVPNFGNNLHSVKNLGENFSTSRNSIIISIGERSAGFFDLVCSHGREEFVFYFNKFSNFLTHSGDSHGGKNLIHTIKFNNSQNHSGKVGLVGYHEKKLHQWYGKSVGLFVVDNETKEAYFIPLDLSETTVGENTAIIPLVYRVENGSIHWYIPQQMPTGKADTHTANRDFMDSCRIDDSPNYETSSTKVAIPDSDDTGFPDNEILTTTPSFEVTSPVQILVGDVDPICDTQVLFLGRSLSPNKKNDGAIIPFLVEGQTLTGPKSMLLTQHVENPKFDPKGRVVFMVDGSKGIDAGLLNAPDIRNLLNAVFVIITSSPDNFDKVNLSVVSYYAGPRSTVVFRVGDDYYLHWGHPQSVIPPPDDLKDGDKWDNFNEFLKVYIRDKSKDDLIVKLDNLHEIPVSLGSYGSTTFSMVEDTLKSFKDSPIKTKLYIIQCLRVLERILEDGDMKKLQAMARKNFNFRVFDGCKECKSRGIHRSKWASELKIMKEKSAIIERLINILICRKYISVDALTAALQKAKANCGQKAAEKIDLWVKISEAIENDDFDGEIFTDFCLGGNLNANYMILKIDGDLFRVVFSEGSREICMSPEVVGFERRLPDMDGYTIGDLRELRGISNKVSPAVPANIDGTENLYLFLPVFDETMPNLTEFRNSVWAGIVTDGMKKTSFVPRDKKFELREIEYKMIYLCLFYMKQLYDMRTTEVTEEDVSDSLVKKIRSIYWLIRAIMLKNVGLLTAEPVCTILNDGKANHRCEIDIAIRLMKMMNKTGLPKSYYESHLENMVRWSLRILYTPYETHFNSLRKMSAEYEKSSQNKLIEFYKDGKSFSSKECNPRIRPKKCGICTVLRSVHEFPRRVNLVASSSKDVKSDKPIYYGPNKLAMDICFDCHGHKNVILVCCTKKCNFRGNVFQFSAGGKKPRAYYCYQNCNPTRGKGKSRTVPPSIGTKMGGIFSPKVKTITSNNSNDDDKLKVYGVFSRTESNDITLAEPLELLMLNTKTTISVEEVVNYMIRLGIISSWENARRELTNIMIMMVEHFNKIPPWLQIVDPVLNGVHNEGIASLPKIFYPVTSGNNSITWEEIVI